MSGGLPGGSGPDFHYCRELPKHASSVFDLGDWRGAPWTPTAPDTIPIGRLH